MDREQALRIQKHLIDADVALDHARMAIAGLGKEERLATDLEPPPLDEEIPTISSRLTWDQVRLPPPVTEADLDGILFSLLKPRWQKTAMVVILAMQRCQERALPIGDEEIAARLQVLADSHRIEGIGDLRYWRHSEVRLKD
jgi:hypothetical protein